MTYGKLWPAHPKPLKDELLSSWIVRVCQANGIKLQTLSRKLFGENLSPWTRDIDRTLPSWLALSYCRKTGVSYQELVQTTLGTYRNLLYAKHRSSGHLQWILTVNQIGTQRQAFGQQFCPVCLASDHIPFFRKYWRVALFTFCPVHDVELYDSCPNCDQPVVYYRVDFKRDIMDSMPITACHACGFDLRLAKSKPVHFPLQEIRDDFYKMLLSVMNPECDRTNYDLHFYDVLHQLCRVMGAKQNKGLLLNYISTRVLQEKTTVPRGWITIEEQRRVDRHTWLICALWLFRDLQNRLHDAWIHKSIRYSLLKKDFEQAPYWFVDIIEKFSDWRNP